MTSGVGPGRGGRGKETSSKLHERWANQPKKMPIGIKIAIILNRAVLLLRAASAAASIGPGRVGTLALVLGGEAAGVVFLEPIILTEIQREKSVLRVIQTAAAATNVHSFLDLRIVTPRWTRGTTFSSASIQIKFNVISCLMQTALIGASFPRRPPPRPRPDLLPDCPRY